MASDVPSSEHLYLQSKCHLLVISLIARIIADYIIIQKSASLGFFDLFLLLAFVLCGFTSSRKAKCQCGRYTLHKDHHQQCLFFGVSYDHVSCTIFQTFVPKTLCSHLSSLAIYLENQCLKLLAKDAMEGTSFPEG